MTFGIDKDSKIPVYSQIARELERQINGGLIKEGERLPSERKLCALTGAARNTVKRAYEELQRCGIAAAGVNGGIYVKHTDGLRAEKNVEGAAREAICRLRDAGISWHETEHLFLEYIWNHLPAPEKIKVAWVDCSAEILAATAGMIEKNCNALVTPLLLDEVMEDCGLLGETNFDIVATTVNHYDDIRRAAKKKLGETLPFETDMVVLTIGRETVSQIAKIETGMQVTVVYDGEWYRYSIERYLKEFAVQGKIAYIPLKDAKAYLMRDSSRKAVILPQDFSYGNDEVKHIFEYCLDCKIFCFAFQQIIDNGSLAHLKKKIQEHWLAAGQNGWSGRNRLWQEPQT